MIDPLLVPMLVLGYAIGSAPIARIFSQIWAGIDIREFGTGNPGAANVYRNVGLVPAVLVAVCNFMQGLGSVLLARAVGLDELQSTWARARTDWVIPAGTHGIRIVRRAGPAEERRPESRPA